jgi:subtilisin family serine protease
MNLGDTYFNWGLKHFNFRDLRRDFEVTGKGVKVLVIDSGRMDNTGDSIDLCTPTGQDMLKAFNQLRDDDNEGKIGLFKELIDPTFVESDRARDLHGSEVCAIIGGNKAGEAREGIAPDCEILVANVFDKKGNQQHELIPLAIYWGLFKKVDIINISQEVETCNDKLSIAIQDAFRRDIPVVCGAGNTDDGHHMSIAYPAAYQTTFGIGSMDFSQIPASGTDQGQLLCFLAPGSDLESYFIGKTPISGSSFAAPFVTGITALYFQKLKDNGKEIPRVADFKRLLTDNTDQHGQFDILTGFGIIDPRRLLESWNKETIVLNDPLLSIMVRSYLQFRMSQEAVIAGGPDLGRSRIVIEI